MDYKHMHDEAKDIYTIQEFNDILADATFTEAFIKKNSGSLNGKVTRTKVDGQPAIMFNDIIENERVGIKIKLYRSNSIILYKYYLIYISLNINQYDLDYTFSHNIIENNFEFLFKHIVSSLIIEDKWQNKY